MDKQTVIINERIAIGISACCMGCPVRYNGKGWDMLKIIGREKSDFKWCPVCPESMAGLGVPREPIHIAGAEGSKIWTEEAEVKNRKGENVTAQIKEGTLVCLEALNRANASAYVYMEGSPSCGVYRTTLKKQKRGNPPGILGSLLLKYGFFLIPASDLQSPLKWWDWRRRLLAFTWVKGIKIENKSDLYSIWYKLKFLCQELDEPWARKMGRKLADLREDQFGKFIEDFRQEVMEVFRKPSTTRKITNSLWKNYSHYRKVSGKTVAEINSPEFKRNITSIAKELIKMERTAIDDKILFGTSPVLYREERKENA
ncbi:DUF523 and DUF1722 domain-containing protein [Petroclostridium sp. X23]|uniref:DUF523 and DUF1722 domain-containing protein n=1 Tax=Petroclostridium sp. X23 TaxID=3045146 RepID=UPI0024AE2F2D|nr:DUF523 and DUF1722 domain-containing protein [Petroclostridium sp. X23]WHH60095.1 DUF523 and DUF1722 domain-containing protein [Petroclostridium sp. X23]